MLSFPSGTASCSLRAPDSLREGRRRQGTRCPVATMLAATVRRFTTSALRRSHYEEGPGKVRWEEGYGPLRRGLKVAGRGLQPGFGEEMA